MIPDRTIVKKINEYDSALYCKWNEITECFEVWRKMENGAHRMITPVVLSIYNNKAPISFVQLDERILWWLMEADSWKHGGSKRHSMEQDRRFQEFCDAQKKSRYGIMRDVVKDYYTHAAAFYTKKHDSKNTGVPKFNNFKKQKFIRPDVQNIVSPRVFYRSNQNAKMYNFRKMK
jgi:hypothetical protein